MKTHRYNDTVEESSRTSERTRLTARGALTRARLVSTAAALMRVRGIGPTTLDDVVAASKASKSQLYRHFNDKPALVRAVIDHVGDETISRERERLQNVKSFAGLVRWRDALIEHAAIEQGRYGCTLGSLANEVSDRDAEARNRLDGLFNVWQELFGGVMRRFQEEKILPDDVDISRLSTGFVAAVQGGYLLAQTANDVAPMRAAIDMAIDHVRLLADNSTS